MAREKNKKEYFKAWSQIIILVVATIAFSYLAGQSDEQNLTSEKNEKMSPWMVLLALFVKVVFNEKSFASAAEGLSINTCVHAKDGRTCVEYPSGSECADKCSESCIPNPASSVNECKLGTCYDTDLGACAPNSRKLACESGGGRWLDDPNGNSPECKRGCCIVGSETRFMTDRECGRTSEIYGLEKNFKAEVTSEANCLLSRVIESRGACVLGKDLVTGKYDCKFTTKSDCDKRKGSFAESALCSNPDLNTRCVKQTTTNCVQGKAEIYWFDSCGNTENVYDVDKTASWNNGLLLSAPSCSLASGNNLIANQGTCGACNYFAGSMCGKETATEKLADQTQNVVCNDLSCRDEKGNVRKQGESWCVYQGSIGVDGNRATDVVGSRHFRKVCINGEIRTEPCEDYRGEVCVESRANSGGNTFSNSACIKNLAYQCLEYNSLGNPSERTEKCNANSACFVKHVGVSSTFVFDICAPRYPEGFNLNERGEGAAASCSIGTQSCTVVWVKKATGKWKCKSNCNCLKPEFAAQMNDLCISLGDCGAKVNYRGQLTTGGASVTNNYLPQAYLDGLLDYKNVVPGKIAEAGNVKDYLSNLGIPNALGEVDENGVAKNPADANGVAMVSMYGGMAGSLFFTASNLNLFGGAAAAPAGDVSLGSVLGAIEGTEGLTVAESIAQTTSTELLAAPTAPTGPTPPAGPGFMGYMGALAGAMIGFSMTAMLLQKTGVGAGLPSWLAYSMMGAGALAGAMIASPAAVAEISSVLGLGEGAWAGMLGIPGMQVIGIAIAIAVVLTIVVMKILGVGKIRKKVITFSCLPWHQPRGGRDCGKCGTDGFPCSQYSCQSLGATCKLVNEGTGQEKCIDSSPNDVSPPLIHPMGSALSEGYEFINSSELGVQLRSKSSADGCIDTFTPVRVGISLSDGNGNPKAGRCRYSSVPLISKNTNIQYTDYSQYSDEFGDEGGLTDDQFAASLTENTDDQFSAGLFKENHTTIITIPTAESLGLEEYNPNERTSFNVYIRCENGNEHEAERDYAINFCVKPGKDETAPRIEKLAKPRLSYIKSGADSQELVFFTNEPADCRWSDGANRGYSIMENNMNCANDFTDRKVYGYECNTTLPITKDESTFYIKCKDKPWETNDTSRYANVEDTILTLRRTTPLEIVSTTPVGGENITFGTSVGSVNVEVRTSGGLDGTAICYFSFDDGASYVDFMRQEGTTSKYVFENFVSGNKRIKFRCTDAVENVAEKTLSFKVEMDSTPPVVARIFASDNTLTVKTNEPATCYASREKCNFDFSKGELMSGEMDYEHTIQLEGRRVVYIRCKDRFDNSMGSCNIAAGVY